MYDFSFLEKFFRNLLLGEDNELKNRTMVIEVPEVWETASAATEQAPNKYRTSTEQVPNKFAVTDENVLQLIAILGKEQKSVKEMLGGLQLKHRPTFLENGKLFGTCTEKRMRVYALPRIAQASTAEIQTDSQGAGCLE